MFFRPSYQQTLNLVAATVAIRPPVLPNATLGIDGASNTAPLHIQYDVKAAARQQHIEGQSKDANNTGDGLPGGAGIVNPAKASPNTGWLGDPIAGDWGL